SVAFQVARVSRTWRAFRTTPLSARPGGRGGGRRVRCDDEATPSATADLAPLAACVAGFVCGPLVGRALLVRRPPALARDLALLFGGHRREPSSLFAFCCNHRSALRLFTDTAVKPRTDLSGPAAV